MPSWKRIGGVELDPAIFAFADGVEAQHSVTISSNHISANGEGQKVVAAGYFVSRIGDTYRFLPRTRVTGSGFSTGSPTGTVSNPEVFVSGDILRQLFPSATITFAGTWAANNILTLVLGGNTVAYPVGDTVLNNIATNVAAAINSNPIHGSMVEAVANGAVVTLQSKDGITLYSLSASEDAGAGTATASGAAFAFNSTPIGTILGVNVDTKTITLAANAAIAVPAGTIIGLPIDELMGIHGKSVDMTLFPSKDIYAAKGAPGVYENRLPYLDGDIRRRLPKLTIAPKF